MSPVHLIPWCLVLPWGYLRTKVSCSALYIYLQPISPPQHWADSFSELFTFFKLAATSKKGLCPLFPFTTVLALDSHTQVDCEHAVVHSSARSPPPCAHCLQKKCDNLLLTFSYLFHYFICWECFVWKAVCVPHACSTRRDRKIPGAGVNCHVTLVIKLGFSGRVASSLNIWTISPAHNFLITSSPFLF